MQTKNCDYVQKIPTYKNYFQQLYNQRTILFRDYFIITPKNYTKVC